MKEIWDVMEREYHDADGNVFHREIKLRPGLLGSGDEETMIETKAKIVKKRKKSTLTPKQREEIRRMTREKMESRVATHEERMKKATREARRNAAHNRRLDREYSDGHKPYDRSDLIHDVEEPTWEWDTRKMMAEEERWQEMNFDWKYSHRIDEPRELFADEPQSIREAHTLARAKEANRKVPIPKGFW